MLGDHVATLSATAGDIRTYKYEIRYVEWIDSCAESGWQPIRDLAKNSPDPCVSVGFVIAESGEHITLMQSHTERLGGDQTGSAALTIPKFAITRSEILRLGAPRPGGSTEPNVTVSGDAKPFDL